MLWMHRRHRDRFVFFIGHARPSRAPHAGTCGGVDDYLLWRRGRTSDHSFVVTAEGIRLGKGTSGALME